MDDSIDSIQALLEPHIGQAGGLITALRKVMSEKGYIREEWMCGIADAFNLSQAEILGVVSFYDDFKTTRPARHMVRLCEAEACQATGSADLFSLLHTQFGLQPGKMTASGSVGMTRVACLGLCACGPAVEMDGKLYARVTPQFLKAAVSEFETLYRSESSKGGYPE